MSQIWNLTKYASDGIRPVHGRRTDGHDEANRVLFTCERDWKLREKSWMASATHQILLE